MGSKFEIGQAQARVEDARFIQGAGRFVDDIDIFGTAHMVLVRSPYAAATIRSIDESGALRLPGVLAVLTADDLLADGIGTLHTSVKRYRRDGSPMPEPAFRLLAQDATRFVGDAVAATVAETLVFAQEAAERVSVEYEDLPSVTDAVAAVQDGAPAVWPEQASDNVCFVFQQGDRAAVDAAFTRAHHVTTLDLRVSRVSANPLEPRNALGMFDAAEGRYTLFYRRADAAQAAGGTCGEDAVRALHGHSRRLAGRGRRLRNEGKSLSRGGPFRNPNEEAADVRFDANGDLTVVLGTHNHGLRHSGA